MTVRVRNVGSNREERTSLAVRIGGDGFYILDAIWSELAPSWLRQIEAVEILRLVWIQQFSVENDVVKLRSADDIPPSSIIINSPYDLDARRGNKRTTIWTGYKVHLSETCDDLEFRLVPGAKLRRLIL